MQEHWEKYKKPIDNRPATVSFNADFIDECGGYEYMYVGFVKVKLKNPKDDGLISDDEIDTISMIEDRLEFEALKWRVGKYVGLIVTNGEVNFVYYLKLDFEWSNAVSEAMKHFDYEYEYGSKEDMQGEVYKNLLYPNIYQWQIINNHNACMQLKSQGDSLEEKRAIEHKAYFSDETSKNAFLEEISKDGFKHLQDISSKAYPYGSSFFRVDKPFFYDIDEITLKLIDTCKHFNGVYDGWECSVILNK